MGTVVATRSFVTQGDGLDTLVVVEGEFRASTDPVVLATPHNWLALPGQGLQTQTATVTTDPDTFEVIHGFDLGRVANAYVSATVLEADPDGEEWGLGDETDDGAGRIAVDVEFIEQSRDGEVWNGNSGYGQPLYLSAQWIRDDQYRGEGGFISLDRPEAGVGYVPLLTHEMVGVSARYVRVLGRIVDSYLLNTYVGANHPSATFRFDVEYV